MREVTDTAGTLLARYPFDPWGRRTVTAGTDVTTVGLTGHRTHTNSGLALALYRGYDAGLLAFRPRHGGDRTKGRTGLTGVEREELTRLRKEDRELRMEREVL